MPCRHCNRAIAHRGNEYFVALRQREGTYNRLDAVSSVLNQRETARVDREPLGYHVGDLLPMQLDPAAEEPGWILFYSVKDSFLFVENSSRGDAKSPVIEVGHPRGQRKQLQAIGSKHQFLYQQRCGLKLRAPKGSELLRQRLRPPEQILKLLSSNENT